LPCPIPSPHLCGDGGQFVLPIPLGIRFQKNGENEVACSLDLLRELTEQLGRRFLDVLVADALYLQAPFVKEIEGLV